MTSTREPLLFLFFIASLTGCRQLAGYSDSAVFDQVKDASTEPDAGETATDDGGSSDVADTSADGAGSVADASDGGANDGEVGDDGAGSDAPLDTDAVTGDAGDGAVGIDDGAVGIDDGAVGIDDGAVGIDDAGSEAMGDAPDEADAAEGDGGVCDPMPPKSGTNLVTNPDFESATSPGAGWSILFGGSFSVSSTHAHCGGQSGAVTGRTAFYNCARYALALPEGGTYSYSLWVMQTGASDIKMAFQWYSATCATMFGPATFTTVHPNTWTRLSGTLTASADCATDDLLVVQQQPPASDAGPDAGADAGPAFPDIYVDDVYVIQ